MCRAKDCIYYKKCLVKRELIGDFCCGDYEAKNTSRKQTAYERTKAQVYATGNKWAIENFHATHD